MKINTVLDKIIKEDNLTKFSNNEIFDHLFYSSDINDRVNLSFSLFHRTPSYHILSEMYMEFENLSTKEKNIFWDQYILILEEKNYNKRIQIVTYSLEIDFFTDTNLKLDAWNNLINRFSNKTGLQRLLKYCSYPIGFEVKLDLYRKNLIFIDMHEPILISIYTSLINSLHKLNFIELRKIFLSLKNCNNSRFFLFVEEYLFKFDHQNETITRDLCKKYKLRIVDQNEKIRLE